MLKSIKIDRIKTVETSIVFALVLLFLAYRYDDVRIAFAAFIMLIVGLILPKLLYPLAKLWFGLGLFLGVFTTKILLTIIFFFLVTPVAYARRLFGNDTLLLKKFKSGSESTFILRNHAYTSDDLKNPF